MNQHITIPHYEAIDSLHPAMVGLVIDGEFNLRDFFAGIADLLVNNLMTIETHSGVITESGANSMIIWRKLPLDEKNSVKLEQSDIRKFLYEKLFKLNQGNSLWEKLIPLGLTSQEVSQGWFIYNNNNQHISQVMTALKSKLSSFDQKGDSTIVNALKGYKDFLETTQIHELTLVNYDSVSNDLKSHFAHAVALGLVEIDDDFTQKQSDYAQKNNFKVGVISREMAENQMRQRYLATKKWLKIGLAFFMIVFLYRIIEMVLKNVEYI